MSAIYGLSRLLCVKRLNITDGFTTRHIKLPRPEARVFAGELRNRQTTMLVLLDEFGCKWDMLCTCAGGQYALSRVGHFCQAHGVRPGCFFIFYADNDSILRLAVRKELPAAVAAVLAAMQAAARPTAAPGPQAAPVEEEEALTACAASPRSHSQEASTSDSRQVQPPVKKQQLQVAPPAGGAQAAAVAAPPSSAAQAAPSEPAAAAAATPAAVTPAASPARTTAGRTPQPLPLKDCSNLPQPPHQQQQARAVAKLTWPLKPGSVAAMLQRQGLPAWPAEGGALEPGCAADGSSPSAAQRQHNTDGSKENSGVPGFDAAVASLFGQCRPAASAIMQVQPSSAAGTAKWTASGVLKACNASAPRVDSLSPQPAPPAPQCRQAVPPQQQQQVQPSWPPSAMRLRIRYEARVRAQAGKKHPLSVRTGPESPLPVPPRSTLPTLLSSFFGSSRGRVVINRETSRSALSRRSGGGAAAAADASCGGGCDGGARSRSRSPVRTSAGCGGGGGKRGGLVKGHRDAASCAHEEQQLTCDEFLMEQDLRGSHQRGHSAAAGDSRGGRPSPRAAPACAAPSMQHVVTTGAGASPAGQLDARHPAPYSDGSAHGSWQQQQQALPQASPHWTIPQLLQRGFLEGMSAWEVVTSLARITQRQQQQEQWERRAAAATAAQQSAQQGGHGAHLFSPPGQAAAACAHASESAPASSARWGGHATGEQHVAAAGGSAAVGGASEAEQQAGPSTPNPASGSSSSSAVGAERRAQGPPIGEPMPKRACLKLLGWEPHLFQPPVAPSPGTMHHMATRTLTASDLTYMVVLPHSLVSTASLLRLFPSERYGGRQHATTMTGLWPAGLQPGASGGGSTQPAQEGSVASPPPPPSPAARRGALQRAVAVVAESGVEYDCALALGNAAGGPPVCGQQCDGDTSSYVWRLAGLMPFFARRQAGVGDVLDLYVDDSGRLHARLHRGPLLAAPPATSLCLPAAASVDAAAPAAAPKAAAGMNVVAANTS